MPTVVLVTTAAGISARVPSGAEPDGPEPCMDLDIRKNPDARCNTQVLLNYCGTVESPDLGTLRFADVPGLTAIGWNGGRADATVCNDERAVWLSVLKFYG
jgi:hypothetical protein